MKGLLGDLMARIKQHFAGDDGWSEWIQPILRGYKLACCDCGLVHDVEFNTLEVTKRHPDGSYTGTILSDKKHRVEFRVRRNSRSTGQVRRRKSK